MKLHFYKYQGTGNDFVLVDNRTGVFGETQQEKIARLCDRKFGIGADGLMLLQNKAGYDFEMVYFNSDGRTSSMCGNGGRCIVAFAHFLGIIEQETTFLAIDGAHQARLTAPNYVELKMNNVSTIERKTDAYFLDTGSPHYVCYVDELATLNVVAEGRKVRYSEPYKASGTNVNFVRAKAPNAIEVATYERGVEDETLSCGTGVTAAAITCALKEGGQSPIQIRTKGGDLQVRFEQVGDQFQDIWLCGPATQVFEGQIAI